jgi:2-methylcitrate dehydratase
MPCRIILTLSNGRVIVKEKRDYVGFRTRPMSWEDVVNKFERLSAPFTDQGLRREVEEAVANLEAIQVADLTRLLAKAQVRAGSGDRTPKKGR